MARTWQANVWRMLYLFYQAAAFNQPIGGWDTGIATDISYMIVLPTRVPRLVADGLGWRRLLVLNITRGSGFELGAALHWRQAESAVKRNCMFEPKVIMCTCVHTLITHACKNINPGT